MPIDPTVKTVYHSALVAAGAIEVTLASDVLESKFKKGTFYVAAKIDGKDHQINIENDRCKAALSGRKGQTVTLEASGTRDDADIAVYAATGQAAQTAPAPAPLPERNLRPAPPPREAAPRQQAQAPQQHAETQQESAPDATGEDPAREAKRTILQIANLYLECALCVQRYVAPTFKRLTGEEMGEAKQQAAASSIFIKADKLGLQTRMASKPM